MKIITDERCMEYSSPGHPERPSRIRTTLAKLRADKKLGIEWLAPLPVSNSTILLAHSDHLLAKVDAETNFDADTPAHPKIGEHARRAVGSALQAMKQAREGHVAFSLMRP